MNHHTGTTENVDAYARGVDKMVDVIADIQTRKPVADEEQRILASADSMSHFGHRELALMLAIMVDRAAMEKLDV